MPSETSYAVAWLSCLQIACDQVHEHGRLMLLVSLTPEQAPHWAGRGLLDDEKVLRGTRYIKDGTWGAFVLIISHLSRSRSRFQRHA